MTNYKAQISNQYQISNILTFGFDLKFELCNLKLFF